MSSGLIEIIKTASMDAMANAQICDLRYGKVVSVSPLKVQVTNQFIIPSSLLVVPQHLTNYKVSVTLNWNEINGTKTMTVNNALEVGDKVALLRKQGGQSYFILDKISNSASSDQSNPTNPSNPDYEIYSGAYTVVPSIEQQIMDTEDKLMTSDVTVTEIPYSEVSNNSNGTTVTIA